MTKTTMPSIYSEPDAPMELEIKPDALIFWVNWKLPTRSYMRTFVSVDLSDNLVAFPYERDAAHREEVIERLIEEDLIEWRGIGGEDHELFAKEKLLKNWDFTPK